MFFLVGKKPSVRTSVSEAAFEANLGEIIVDGKLASSSSAVFYKLADCLKISKQAAYLAAKRFVVRNDSVLRDKVEQDSEDDDQIDDKDCVSEDDNDDDFLPNMRMVQSSGKPHIPDMSFIINIQDIEIFTDKNNANILTSIVWEFARVPCSWSFERIQKICNEITVTGRCLNANCEAKLVAYTENMQSKLNLKITQYKENVVHNKKQNISQQYQAKILDMLKINSACVVRAQLADELMSSQDREPAHLPTSSTLRVIKHRDKKKKLLHENAVLALREMKNDPNFTNCIGDIGLDPFYCSYSLPLQEEWLRISTRFRRTVMSIDSSGKNFVNRF